MPTVSLVGSSQIFVSGGGWISPARWNGEPVFGLDRHGRLREGQLSLQPVGLATPAFVGTKSTFAALGPETVLIDATGRRVEVTQIIRKGDISEVRLEVVFPDLPTHSDMFWRQLAHIAIGIRPNSILLSGSLSSIVIDRPASAEALGHALLDFLARDDGSILLRRSHTGILAWILTVLRSGAERRHACLSFDSLQHTGSVTLQIMQARPVNDLKGACAFFGAAQEPAFHARWTEAGWNPICSGLVLAGAP